MISARCTSDGGRFSAADGATRTQRAVRRAAHSLCELLGRRRAAAERERSAARDAAPLLLAVADEQGRVCRDDIYEIISPRSRFTESLGEVYIVSRRGVHKSLGEVG